MDFPPYHAWKCVWYTLEMYGNVYHYFEMCDEMPCHVPYHFGSSKACVMNFFWAFYNDY